MSVSQRTRSTRRTKPPVDPEELPVGGSVEHVCRLADDLLAAVVALQAAPRGQLEALVHADGKWRRCETAVTKLDTVSTNGSGARHRALVVLRLPEDVDGKLDPLALRTKSGDVALEHHQGVVTNDVDRLLRELLAMPPQARPSLLDFLVQDVPGGTRAPRTLAASLNRLRDGLRERLPLSVVEPDEPRAVAVDAIWRLDEGAFYVEGWARHDGASLESLTAVTPEGERIELGETVFRYARPDVSEFYGAEGTAAERLGFIAYLETTTPSVLPDGWVVELRDSAGGRIEVRAPQVTRDLVAARSTILGDILHEPLPAEELKTQHLRPAIELVQRRLAARVSIDAVDEVGSQPRDPQVSVIVPLFRRVDFVEHQLAQFVHDPELRETELVYVLDSPEQAEYLRAYARQLHRLYGVPFRVVTLTANGGFSLANNLGAAVSTGRLLLLLNSDVLPERQGWVGQLAAFYDSDRRIGALAPKLVYEDESLQHAGLYFDRPDGSFTWANEHFFKGLHRDLPGANVARAVPAVTGASTMISRELFEELGGLSAGYVQGDYEDSDLCLRLEAMGLERWYLPSVALYHLEGQSYPSQERMLASQYNKWLHTHLWGDAIDRVMAEWKEAA